MKTRWTESAADDLDRIARYIEDDNPEAALRVVQAIFEQCELLAEMPYRGRKGKRHGTREFIFRDLPYLTAYRVVDDAVEILRIWHGAQDR